MTLAITVRRNTVNGHFELELLSSTVNQSVQAGHPDSLAQACRNLGDAIEREAVRRGEVAMLDRGDDD